MEVAELAADQGRGYGLLLLLERFAARLQEETGIRVLVGTAPLDVKEPTLTIIPGPISFGEGSGWEGGDNEPVTLVIPVRVELRLQGSSDEYVIAEQLISSFLVGVALRDPVRIDVALGQKAAVKMSPNAEESPGWQVEEEGQGSTFRQVWDGALEMDFSLFRDRGGKPLYEYPGYLFIVKLPGYGNGE